jgi:predicted transcriptional regulator
MKNVTITMDDGLVRKARVAAAHEGKSLSRFVAEAVERCLGGTPAQKEAIKRFLAGPLWESDGGPLPTRDEVHAERLHRHERADLPARQGFADEGGAGG